ncbi:hypothetical protein [Pseudomonas sp. Irchel 3A5]|uniref:hypothetical protein n=1 Tax=Pseudomonas sp. Irchel 3A5 TaxID=2008911 RepID=UPI000BA399A6|nr:hypothetical protein [Pseudomonas sp. Irchel 3A5]
MENACAAHNLCQTTSNRSGYQGSHPQTIMAKGHLKNTIQHDNRRNKKSHRDPSSIQVYLQQAIICGCETVATFLASLASSGLPK